MSGALKHPHGFSWLFATGLLSFVAACGLPINSAGSGRPLPIESMAQAFANEPAEVKFSGQEIYQADYTSDWHDSGQPFPSDPYGFRGGGSITVDMRSGDYHGGTQFEITPHTDSVRLPPIAQGQPDLGIKISVVINCSQTGVYAKSVVTEMGQDDDVTLIEINERPQPDDPICVFIWPGMLAHRILPPDEQPITLDDYFTTLAKHDFVHTHTIRMYFERIRVYTWETETDGVLERREIGLNKDNRLFYLNWWRSEPYEGENINRHSLSRSCTGTCD